MTRYRIITYNGLNAKRGLSLNDAKEQAEAWSAELGIKDSFSVRLDLLFTLLGLLSKILRILYAPIYFIGVLILFLGRLFIGIAYFMLLQKRAAFNVFKFMFTW